MPEPVLPQFPQKSGISCFPQTLKSRLVSPSPSCMEHPGDTQHLLEGMLEFSWSRDLIPARQETPEVLSHSQIPTDTTGNQDLPPLAVLVRLEKKRGDGGNQIPEIPIARGIRARGGIPAGFTIRNV